MHQRNEMSTYSGIKHNYYDTCTSLDNLVPRGVYARCVHSILITFDYNTSDTRNIIFNFSRRGTANDLQTEVGTNPKSNPNFWNQSNPSWLQINSKSNPPAGIQIQSNPNPQIQSIKIHNSLKMLSLTRVWFDY